MHALSVQLDDVHRQTAGRGDGYRYFSKSALVVCFVARPGHTYEARPVYAGQSWRPGIVDESRAELVRSWVVDSPAGTMHDGERERRERMTIGHCLNDVAVATVGDGRPKC